MSDLLVTAIGAMSPIGFDAVQTALSFRAGLRPIAPVPFKDEAGDQIGAIFNASFPTDLIGDERLIELAKPALTESLVGAMEGERMPLVLALDEGRDILGELVEGAGRIDLSRSETIRAGHAGFGVAIDRAGQLLESGAEEVMVGAVASYCDPFVLRKLDKEFAIQSRRAGNGFVPSEAAVFARVRRPKSGAGGICRVRAVRCGKEPTIGTELPNCGEAMTSLLATLEEVVEAPVGWVLTDANGEPHRSRELSLLLTRSRRVIDPDGDIVAMGRVLGDVASASMGLGFVVAAMTLHLKGGGAQPALVLGHAESGERAVLLLGAAGG